MTVLIDERQLLSGLRRVQVENADLRTRLDAAEHNLREARRQVRERLSGRQARAILDENAELRRMNEILLKRNEALARKQRCT